MIAKELNVKQTEARVAYYKQSAQIKKSKRISYSKDVRLALNTIRQSIDMVSGSGMSIKTTESDHEDHYEIVIQIPKRS
ncbi:Nucleoid occlusion protein [compost metagenome]